MCCWNFKRYVLVLILLFSSLQEIILGPCPHKRCTVNYSIAIYVGAQPCIFGPLRVFLIWQMTCLMINEEGSPVFKREETPPKSAVGNYTQRMFAGGLNFLLLGL